MIGVLINVATVVIGSLIGCFFSAKINEDINRNVMRAIALTVLVIGIKYIINDTDPMLILICLVIGTVIGTVLKLEDRINGLAGKMSEKLEASGRKTGKFAEAFTTTSIIFCVGTMTIMGSIQAGMEHNYNTLIIKSIMDGISSVVYASALGIGVIFSAVSVFVIQGSIALFAGYIGPYLGEAVINSMNAVGGAMFLGLAVNMLDISDRKVRIGDMIPAIFLPIAYIPIANWLSSVF